MITSEKECGNFFGNLFRYNREVRIRINDRVQYINQVTALLVISVLSIWKSNDSEAYRVKLQSPNHIFSIV